ncbi:MAG: zinc ribbon domain-containing protein [Deltaproteobacteria bacterium]|nr:zinc ribbon domain-containing protein [Deltaproteobacteria bacterium]
MPTYEYQCTACGHHFERRQSINDEKIRECPECQGEVELLISGGSGFILKVGSAAPGGSKFSCPAAKSGETCCGSDSPCDKPAD